MPVGDGVLVVVLALELSLGFALTYLTWAKRRRTRTAQPLLVILGLVLFGQGAMMLQILSPSLPLKLLFYKLAWNAEFMLAAPWLVFCLYFAGEDEYANPVHIGAVLLPFVAFSVLLWFNPANLYIRSFDLTPAGGLAVEYGLWFWATVVYGYSVVAISVALVLRQYFASSAYHRPIGMLLVGVFVPWIATLVQFAGILPSQRYNPTPFVLLIPPAAWYVAIFHMGVLEVVPIARDQVMEVMQEGVIVADDAGRIIDANPAARRLLAVEADLEGGQLTSAFASMVDDPATLFTESSIEASVSNGGQRHLDIRSQPIVDPTEGEQAGHLVLIRDVTPIRERELELQRRTEQLDEFASVVSHDLRNPLDIAQGYVEMIEDTGDLELLDEIDDALRRMEDIIADALALAREGQSVEETRLVSLTSIAREAWRTVDTAEATLETSADAIVRADPERLRRVLENLFRNAVEHGGEDVTVVVGTMGDGETGASNGASDVRGFYVADDGRGIPAEARGDVFERGYSTSGTGLGLAIVRRIAEAHDWEVEVTESDAGGARFEFTGVQFKSR